LRLKGIDIVAFYRDKILLGPAGGGMHPHIPLESRLLSSVRCLSRMYCSQTVGLIGKHFTRIIIRVINLGMPNLGNAVQGKGIQIGG